MYLCGRLNEPQKARFPTSNPLHCNTLQRHSGGRQGIVTFFTMFCTVPAPNCQPLFYDSANAEAIILRRDATLVKIKLRLPTKLSGTEQRYNQLHIPIAMIDDAQQHAETCEAIDTLNQLGTSQKNHYGKKVAEKSINRRQQREQS